MQLKSFHIVKFQHNCFHAQRTLDRPVVAKQHYYVRSRKKSSIMLEFQLNLQKHVNIYCWCLNKISIKRKKLCCKKF